MSVELLAPAGDFDALVAAVQNGADAVYLGAQCLNARAGAGNFDREGLRRAVDYAHERGARVHVTVNTMLKDGEEGQLYDVADEIAYAGADAAIVQDLGAAALLKAVLPSLPLHASTQMAIHNRQGAAFAREAGFDRVVLAREMSYAEIAECAREGIELEAFVHGALCVSCSGQCLFSSLIGGRSGNRGRCAQPCRLPYRLEGAVKGGGYLLSTKDLMSLEHLGALCESGVTSLKIEGRLKRREYVAEVTRVYREALDLLESYGEYEPDDDAREALLQIFNRGGFTQGYGPGLIDRELMSPGKPNHAGFPVGELTAPGKIRLTRDVLSADTLAFRDKGGEEYPVRSLSGAAGETVRVRTPDGARPGAKLYRLVSDAQMKRARESVNGEHRAEYVSGYLRARVGEPIRLIVTMDGQCVEKSGAVVEKALSKGADIERVRSQLMKTGGVPYEFIDLTLDVDESAFLPASLLNEMRRDALNELSEKRIEAERGCKRTLKSRPAVPNPDAEAPKGTKVRVQSSNMDVLRAALDAGADEAVFLPEDITTEGLDAAIAGASFPFALALSGTMAGETLGLLCEWAHDHIDRITSVLVSNPGALTLDWGGCPLELDAGLNLANRRAIDFYWSDDVIRYTPSIELNTREIRALGGGGRRELIVYGRLQLMTLRHCPIRARMDGAHDACRRCDNVPESERTDAHALIDRTGAAFPLRRQRSGEGCIVKLMNSVPMQLLRHIDRLPPAESWRLIMTDETPEEAAGITRLYRAALNHADYERDPAWARLNERPSTTGHYFRGVE